MENLSKVIDKIEKNEINKRDVVVSRKDFNFIVMDGKLKVIVKDKEVSLTYDIAQFFKRNIAEIVGMPLRFFEYLEKDHTDLLAHNLNELIVYNPVGNLLLRTMMKKDKYTVRALLSDRYRIIDNLQVLEAVLYSIRGMEFKSTVIVNDDYLFCVIDFVGSSRDIGGVKICNSLLIVNSEVGDGAFKIVPRFNIENVGGFTFTDLKISKNHIGQKKQKGVVCDLDLNKELVSTIKENVNDYIGSNKFDDYLYSVGHVFEKRFNNILSVLQNIIKALPLSEEKRSECVKEFLSTNKTTGLDLVKSIVKVIHDIPARDREYIETNIIQVILKHK